MKWDDVDDKQLVIVAVFLLALAGMFLLQDAGAIVEKAMYGLFGMAVGKAMVK